MHPQSDDAGARPIRLDERSGVLHPANLLRYGAQWFDPAPVIADVVEQYWRVEWNLASGERIYQTILAAPAVNLTIEEGSVPAPYVVTGVHRSAWRREITGSGSVFGIRLRPAGLAVLSDLLPRQISDRTLALTPELDAELCQLVRSVGAEESADHRVRAANALIRARLAERPLSREQLLANAIVDQLTETIRDRAGSTLADTVGASERAVQRALQHTLGHGPKWVSRWIRLQEVARALSAPAEPDFARLAAELNYFDQAHLVNDFRRAAGVSPSAYVRSVRLLGSG